MDKIGIIPESITLEGFGSYVEEQTFNFQQSGLHLLTSPNGFGKTTLFNAISWVNYGKSLKENSSIASWSHIRTPKYKGTKVTMVQWCNGKKLEVIRMLEYLGKVDGRQGGDRLIVKIDGVKLNERGKRELQKKIEETLGYSFELFKSAIMFGQKMKRLIEDTGPNKYNILQESLDQTFFINAKEAAEKDYKKNRDELTKADLNFQSLQIKVEGIKDNIKNRKELIEYFEDNKQTKLKELRTTREKLKTLSADIVNREEAQKRKQEKLEKVRALIPKDIPNTKTLENKLFVLSLNESGKALKLLQDQLKTHKEGYSKIPTHCPNCGVKLNKDKVRQERLRVKDAGIKLKKEIELIKSRVKAEKEIIGSLEKRLASKKELVSQIEQHVLLRNKLETELKSEELNLKSILSSLNKDLGENLKRIKLTKASKPNIEIEPLQDELKKQKVKLKQVAKSLKVLKREERAIGWVLKEALSNSGLKAFVFNAILQDLNYAISRYTSIMGLWKIEFKVDLEAKNKSIYTLIYQGDIPIAYEDLSGGQAQLVNICTALGLNDLVTKNKPLSVLFLDEVFEGLDSSNIELVTDLIKEKATHQAVYLVTHRKEFHTTTSSRQAIEYITPGISRIV